MSWNYVSFCPTIAGLNIGLLCREISSLLFGGQQAAVALKDWYDEMVRNYLVMPQGSVVKKAYEKVIPLAQFSPQIHDVRALFNRPSFGHDAPTWLKPKNNFNKVKVMIVSQDPKRGDVTNGCLSLGSPFGFHDAHYRSPCLKCCNVQMYELVEKLLAGGAMVYLTDADKFYNSDNFVKDKAAQRRIYRPIFRRVLDWEIEHYNPDLIIAVSEIAADMVGAEKPKITRGLQNLNDRVSCFSVYHPAARNQGSNLIARLSNARSQILAEVSRIAATKNI